MSNNLNDIWQICILTDTNQSILVTINKNASVAELFKKFRTEHSDFTIQRHLTFLVVDGLELQENDRRRLFDVDSLRNGGHIRLIVHADGGVWLTEIEIRTQIRNPNNVPSLAGRITNDVPDVMGLDDDIPRVKMSCGHAIAPTSLALYCYSEIENGAHSIQCPALKCNTVWSLASIIEAACLSSNETNEFELKMISNKLVDQSQAIRKCPGCGTFCRRLNETETRINCIKCTSDKARQFDFCWSCLKEWRNGNREALCGNIECGDHTSLLELLATCDTKKLNGVECPSKRACPSCFMLIEHKDKCKHMTCPKKSCKYEFCFICLKKYPCETGYFEACNPAPRQQSVSPP